VKRNISFFHEPNEDEIQPSRMAQWKKWLIYLFLAIKVLSVQTIHNELVVMFGISSIAYSIVTRIYPTVIVLSSLSHSRREFDDHYQKHNHWYTRKIIILFCSKAGQAHLHSNYYNPLTPHAITWVHGKTSSLDSP
jgi:hypothetical protein